MKQQMELGVMWIAAMSSVRHRIVNTAQHSAFNLRRADRGDRADP
jgi:hypothetical protein